MEVGVQGGSSVGRSGRAEHRAAPSAGLSPLSDADGAVTSAANLACYMQDPDFGYQDFARRDEDQTQVFRVQVRFLLFPPLPSSLWLQGACPAHIWHSCFGTVSVQGSSALRGVWPREPWGEGGDQGLLSPRTADSFPFHQVQNLPDEGCCGLWQTMPRANLLNSAAS